MMYRHAREEGESRAAASLRSGCVSRVCRRLQADRPLCPRRPRVRTGGRREQRVLRADWRREALGPLLDRKRSRGRDAGSRRFLRRRMPRWTADPHGHGGGGCADHRAEHPQAGDDSNAPRTTGILGSVHRPYALRATSASRKIWSISSSTRARSGSRARCSCLHVTGKRMRPTESFRCSRRKHSRRWSGRPGLV